MSKYALLVGCNYFGGNRLMGCINDVNLMREILVKNNYKVIMMTDEARSLTSITNIRNVDSLTNKTYFPFSLFFDWILNYLANNLKAEDKLYVHFSGHGSQAPASDQFEQDKLDETIVLYRTRGVLSHYVDNNLNFHFNKMKCSVFSVFDSCHSASILDLVSSYRYTVPTVQDSRGESSKGTLKNHSSISRVLSKKSAERAYRNVFRNSKLSLWNREGKIVNNNRLKSISGCADTLYSYDVKILDKGIFHGALTYAISLELSKPYSTIQDFIDGVTKQVWVINGHDKQTPLYIYTTTENLFKIF